MKKVRLVVAITVISLLLPYTVIANSAKFDATKSWNNMVTVTYGVHDGSGNPDRNFTIKNEYGKVLSFTLVDTFDNDDAKYWLIANDRYGTKLLGDSTKYSVVEEGNLGKYVNEAFVQAEPWEWNLPKGIIECLDTDHEWWTEKAFAGETVTEAFSINAGVVIPAVWELEQYGENIMINFLPEYNANYVFRTPFNDSYYHGIQLNNITQSNGKYRFKLVPMKVSATTVGIRPEFFVNKDFFKTAKIDLSSAGEDILTEISKYSYEELTQIYSDADIELYLPSVDVPEPVATVSVDTTDNKGADVGNTLKAVVSGEAVQTETPVFSWYADDKLIENENTDELILTYEHFQKNIVCRVDIAGETVVSNSVSVGGLFNPATYANMSWVYIDSNDGKGNEKYDFEVDGKSFTLLDTYNNEKSKYLVIANDLYGNQPIGQTTALYNPDETGTFAEYVNDVIAVYDENNKNCLPKAVSEHINFEHIWITEKAHDGDEIPKTYTFKAGVTIPGVWEMLGYSDKIKVQVGDYLQYIFRSAISNTHYHSLDVEDAVKLQLSGDKYRWKLAPKNVTGSGGIRPIFCLDGDFFGSTKINLSKSGAHIKEIIEKECTREQLLEYYSEQELIDAGFGANYDIEAEWKSNNGILESLSGVSEITADICVTSRMTEDKDMVLIMELFDEDNNIVAMDAISVKAKSNETVVPEDILKISDLSNITEDYTLKIFIWDNIISMKSLNKHIVFGESYK